VQWRMQDFVNREAFHPLFEEPTGSEIRGYQPGKFFKLAESQSPSKNCKNCCAAAAGKIATRRLISRIILASVVNASSRRRRGLTLHLALYLVVGGLTPLQNPVHSDFKAEPALSPQCCLRSDATATVYVCTADVIIVSSQLRSLCPSRSVQPEDRRGRQETCRSSLRRSNFEPEILIRSFDQPSSQYQAVTAMTAEQGLPWGHAPPPAVRTLTSLWLPNK